MLAHTLFVTLAAASASALVTRQTNSGNSQVIDLNGPQVKYEGRWLDVTSPCNSSRTAKKSDNTRADDVKAIITFADNVKAFTINVETDSRNFDYTIETEDVTQRYNAMNNAGPAAGQTGCPALFSHNFGNGPKVANVTFRMPRSAKRSELLERQGGFSLPSIQINEVAALLDVVNEGTQSDGAGSENNNNNGNSNADGNDNGSAMSVFAFQRALLPMAVGALALAYYVV